MKNAIKILTIIVLAASICNFCYLMFYEIKSVLINPYCCEMADDTEKDRMEKREQSEIFEQQKVLAKEKVEQIEPICSNVGCICLICLFVLFMFSFIKKETKVTKFFIGGFIILNILFVLIELGG